MVNLVLYQDWGILKTQRNGALMHKACADWFHVVVQDRKVKEKSKRALGQSSHSHWKSEAEMVLRQQYDS